MKLRNNATRSYGYEDIILKAGEEIEITDKLAFETLLSQDGVEEVVDKKEVEELKAEVEKLKKENKAKASKGKNK